MDTPTGRSRFTDVAEAIDARARTQRFAGGSSPESILAASVKELPARGVAYEAKWDGYRWAGRSSGAPPWTRRVPRRRFGEPKKEIGPRGRRRDTDNLRE
ncbi:hypothetical protein [Streptomyces sp. MOE7]|uniref:hypothetical protein n=1 Tax=Streptomyces sp. MOE7 TaxID=1961713 RepID=UPI0011E4D4EE|nr:hypothetical protein [Streptomyces sp. MOE7]